MGMRPIEVAARGSEAKDPARPLPASSRRLVRAARAVVPWLIATALATLLGQELAPKVRGTAVTPPPPVTEPVKKEEVVYEPWEQVST